MVDDFFRSLEEMTADEVGRVRLIVAATSSTAPKTHIASSLFMPVDVLTVDSLGLVIEIIAVVIDDRLPGSGARLPSLSLVLNASDESIAAEKIDHFVYGIFHGV